MKLIIGILFVAFSLFVDRTVVIEASGWWPTKEFDSSPEVTMNSVGGIREVREKELLGEKLYFKLPKLSELEAWATGGLLLILVIGVYWSMLPCSGVNCV